MYPLYGCAPKNRAEKRMNVENSTNTIDPIKVVRDTEVTRIVSKAVCAREFFDYIKLNSQQERKAQICSNCGGPTGSSNHNNPA